MTRIARALLPAVAVVAVLAPPSAARPVSVCHLTTAAPVAQGTCPGVRPGARVRVGNSICSMAFLFKGSDRRTYIATAGHCALLGKQGEKVWKGIRAPTASDSVGNYIGNFAYASFHWVNTTSSPAPESDFALIRLEPGVKANPAMCHFGGPDGIYQKHEATPSVLHYFGRSPMYDDVLPARSAIAPNTLDQSGVFSIGESAGGDSGSGVINGQGEAVGILTGSVGYMTPIGPFGHGDTVIARLDEDLKRAQRALHIKLTIRSAAVSPNTEL
jgi:hypothetical protein